MTTDHLESVRFASIVTAAIKAALAPWATRLTLLEGQLRALPVREGREAAVREEAGRLIAAQTIRIEALEQQLRAADRAIAGSRAELDDARERLREVEAKTALTRRLETRVSRAEEQITAARAGLSTLQTERELVTRPS